MAFVIKPGNVLLTRGKNRYSNMIAHGMGDYYTHALWVRAVGEDTFMVQESTGTKDKGVKTHMVEKSYFEELYKENRLKIMDFGINAQDHTFELYCERIEGTPYDYLSVFTIAYRRVMSVFRKDTAKALFKVKKGKHALDCSEMIARGLHDIKGIDVLGLLGKEEYDYVRPQELSVLYDKWVVRNNVQQ